MIVIRILLLIIELSILKCASTEEKTGNINVTNYETPSKTDIFSRHLNEQLLHKVLEYDAKSTGRMAMANRALQKLAVVTRTFRYFEGAGWDMPELANICEFGVTDAINRPTLETEKARILGLSHYKDETVFNDILKNLLLQDKYFKELASPVLKYLTRRFYERKDSAKDEGTENLRRFLIFAVENKFYDVFFELGKDASVWNGDKLEDIVHGDVHDCFYFDCYNNYVYDSNSASKYIWKKIAYEFEHRDILRIESIAPDEIKLSHRELSAWIAVCIYRRLPEEEYKCKPFLSKMPQHFLVIMEFIFKYSPITFDIDEKGRFHEFIVKLLDKYFGDKKSLESFVKFVKLLNDIRFDESFYEDRILPFVKINGRQKLEMLTMAASKANNKLLVKQLAKNPGFPIQSLSRMVELKCSHCFKVYFDLIESEPLQDINGIVNYAHTELIHAIVRNKFKITKTTTTDFGDEFEIQSPNEYVEIGFASKYQILLKPNESISYIYALVEKMLNDAAKAGAAEFISLIIEHCGEQVVEPNKIRFLSFKVSYEIIQILIGHPKLIELLANRKIKLICNDKRIDPNEIANFRRVINPN